MWIVDDLIVAPATERASGGRAVVRLSGPGLSGVLDALVIHPAAAGGFTRSAVLRDIAAVGGGTFGPVPVRLLAWPDGRGPVGMAAAELHLPGSVPLLDAVVARCLQLGARLARGGEFSLRAFLSGRIDLVQAEAVLAVVESRSPEDLTAALDRLSGGLGRELEAARQRLLDIAADLEAMIDFGDEAIDPSAQGDFARALVERLGLARDLIGGLLSRLGGRTATVSEMPRVVIVGPPNVGKSSLYNVLVRRSAALVSDQAGTTRDYLESVVTGEDAGKVAYVLVDVAGIDGAVSSGDASTEGIAASADAAAREQVARADVLVVCRDAGATQEFPPIGGLGRIDVMTRCDRLASAADDAGRQAGGEVGDGPIRTSSLTATGIAALRRAIAAAVLRTRVGTPAALRVAAGLIEADEAVGRAMSAAGETTERQAFDEAVVASHVGRAIAAIAAVTGRDVGLELLDRVFARHCIGK